MRRIATCVAVLVPLALVLAAASPAGRASTAPPVSFTDPGGDSGTAADITTVAVTNDDKGLYTIDVGFATPYGDTGIFLLYLDTDMDPSTGDAFGAEYLLADDHGSHSFSLEKWSGTDWLDTPQSTAAFTIASDDKSLTAAVNRSELGGATGFDFILLTTDGDLSDGHFDDAPSGTGSFDYKQQETFGLALAAAKMTAAKAGGTWSLVTSVTRSDTGMTLGPEATIACKGTSGAKKLAVSTRAFVSSGSGGISVAVCAFKVAKTLKGKTLHGTISVSYKGQTVTKTFTAKAK
jgi:hypothetical protein